MLRLSMHSVSQSRDSYATQSSSHALSSSLANPAMLLVYNSLILKKGPQVETVSNMPRKRFVTPCPGFFSQYLTLTEMNGVLGYHHSTWLTKSLAIKFYPGATLALYPRRICLLCRGRKKKGLRDMQLHFGNGARNRSNRICRQWKCYTLRSIFEFCFNFW